jgi:hypothetical protein
MPKKVSTQNANASVDPSWTAPLGIDVAHTMRFVSEASIVGEVIWKNHSDGMRAMTIGVI